MEDWTAFGRVDSDGTVYVKTAGGERAVGSWQAGTPEEGLAHFARRFDDLVTEVNLIEARLGSGAADAQSRPVDHQAHPRDACPRRTSSATSTACPRGWRSSPASRRRRPTSPARPATPPGSKPLAAQDRAGDRGRVARRRVDQLEGDRRPVQGDPRRVEDDPRRRPQDRRRAVEAVTPPRGTRSPAVAAATSPPSTRPASRPRAARTSWSPRPSRCPTRPSGTRPPTGSRS